MEETDGGRRKKKAPGKRTVRKKPPVEKARAVVTRQMDPKVLQLLSELQTKVAKIDKNHAELVKSRVVPAIDRATPSQADIVRFMLERQQNIAKMSYVTPAEAEVLKAAIAKDMSSHVASLPGSVISVARANEMENRFIQMLETIDQKVVGTPTGSEIMRIGDESIPRIAGPVVIEAIEDDPDPATGEAVIVDREIPLSDPSVARGVLPPLIHHPSTGQPIEFEHEFEDLHQKAQGRVMLTKKRIERVVSIMKGQGIDTAPFERVTASMSRNTLSGKPAHDLWKRFGDEWKKLPVALRHRIKDDAYMRLIDSRGHPLGAVLPGGPRR